MICICQSSRISQVVAIMVFTRYGDPFSESEIAEYETLARQMAIYLEKIRLFEQSENDRRLNQDILNTVQEGIQLIDKDRKIIQVNQQLCEIFKWNNTLMNYWDFHGNNGAI